MSIGQRIKQRRKQLGMSAETLAEKIGKSASTIYRYEKGEISHVDSDVLWPIAQALITTPAYLMGWSSEAAPASPFGKPIDGLIPRSQVRIKQVPILGDTAAGEPVIANREYDEWVEVPDDGHRFDAALRVTGDSMAPKYQKGDLVFVRYQEDVQDGQIAVICLNDGVTLKRLYHIPDGVQLLSENRDYPPMVFTTADGSAHLVGLAVGVLHWDD